MTAQGSDFVYKKSRYRTLDLPRWRYSLLRPYNGFTGIERIRCWQLVTWGIAAGIIRAPHICSVSGVTGGYGAIQYHSENYYSAFEQYPIHKALHATLHKRFKNPDQWRLLVERHRYRAADPWFAELLLEEFDLASALRKQGINGQTMVATFLKALPTGCPKPYGRLHTLKDFNADGTLIMPRKKLKLVSQQE